MLVKERQRSLWKLDEGYSRAIESSANRNTEMEALRGLARVHKDLRDQEASRAGNFESLARDLYLTDDKELFRALVYRLLKA